MFMIAICEYSVEE